jgi:hypothetical protein
LHLKKITRILIIAIICSFSIRIVGTVFPQIFQNIHMVKGTILVNTFFILSHLLFWLLFYRDYASVKDAILKKTCLLPVIGSFAVALLYLKKLPFVFDMEIAFPLFLMNPYVDAFVPAVTSIFSLIFFVVFRNSIKLEEEMMLRKPVLSMIGGISIFLLLHLIVLVNFVATDSFQWLEHMPRAIAVGTVPLIIIAVFLMLHFYYRFYCLLESLQNKNDI